MNISLTPELEKLVHEKVSSGLYQTASEVVREGLRLLNERDRGVEALRREVRAGFAAVDEGQFSDYDETGIRKLAGRVKAKGRARLREESVRPDAK